MKSQTCTIRDIAQAAQVSPTTVSRVFAGHDYVSPETRELVLSIAKEHGYTPKQYHRRLNSRRSDVVVGIVVADLHNPFFLQMIDRAEQVLMEQGVNVILCNSDESSQREICNLSVLKHRVNGIIISPVSEMVKYNREFLHELNTSGTPIVLIDRDLKGVGLDGVFQENYNGAIASVEVLIRNGHRHIATIAGPTSSKPGLDRLNGYLDALRLNDIPVRQEYIGYGDFKMESGYQLAQKLLTSYKEITALYCSNNLMAIGALRAIHDMNIQVPDDIAFICNGSLHQYDLLHDSAITEFVEPIDLMGEECAMMMLEKLNGGKKRNRAARRISYDGHLVLKGSEVYPKHRGKPNSPSAT